MKALSRSGSSPPGVDADPLLTSAACDVRDPSTIDVSGAGAVIYAASGSKKGGSPHEVDNLGVVNAAKACVAAKVPRLVVISSTAVTRPDSLGYKFTDVYGKIMGEKKLGEDGVYAVSASSDLAYTIIRPGGLEEPKENIVQGPGALEISQVRRGVLIFPPRRHRRDPSAGRRAGRDHLAQRPGRGRGRGVREPGPAGIQRSSSTTPRARSPAKENSRSSWPTRPSRGSTATRTPRSSRASARTAPTTSPRNNK